MSRRRKRLLFHPSETNILTPEELRTRDVTLRALEIEVEEFNDDSSGYAIIGGVQPPES